MKKITYKLLSLLCLTLLFMGQACKKDKVDHILDNRVLTDNRANSTARIINLGGFNQVIANGDSLTNFVVRNNIGPDSYKFPGTSYFPIDGRLGKTWNVPQDLFDAQGSAKFDFMSRLYQPTLLPDIKVEVKNDYSNPTDYFLMPSVFMTGQPEVVPIKRGVAAPSKPDHFKIRIVNLSGEIKNKGNNASGLLEDLTGSVSLAFADGTLVDPQTNNISSAKQSSEYIEIPYGTYQFKILMQNGRQMPALGSELYEFTLIDPPTSTIPNNLMNSTALTYAPIQTYQPGGIYTILVAPQRYNYLINEIGETSDTYQNSFQIINDNSVPANNTYFRIHGANAWDAQQISFRSNGKVIANNLDFGNVSEYANFVHGNHTVEALDAKGKVIASAQQTLRPAQNYTAWLYQDPSGAAKLLIVANDLSGAISSQNTNQDDATFARTQQKFFFFKRFLNFSGDNPYITFTSNNGQPVGAGNSAVGVNMQPGVPLFERPFASGSYNQPAFDLMVYRSKPNVVPGIWANDINKLKNDDFIAKKELYTQASRKIPVQEAGIYTIALIGKTAATSLATQAKMIIVKHNK
ncbi:DUF4397 domain-containing protein [Pedobacter xixiisoli]|uniref:DUF4397 domain-containing protein n=1 Tax=Pedobacter xixiisoli TaxID=1476464 RepID=A0A285ZUN2_9SPHI|nr:DUF4397 domain-containing protein [Pedobacter xixiisoli]SOD13350.1 hypothetical protein SAMN06297358_1177 [Pedobacter xixiisoli]